MAVSPLMATLSPRKSRLAPSLAMSFTEPRRVALKGPADRLEPTRRSLEDLSGRRPGLSPRPSHHWISFAISWVSPRA